MKEEIPKEDLVEALSVIVGFNKGAKGYLQVVEATGNKEMIVKLTKDIEGSQTAIDSLTNSINDK